jgi:hypothetical protein
VKSHGIIIEYILYTSISKTLKRKKHSKKLVTFSSRCLKIHVLATCNFARDMKSMAVQVRLDRSKWIFSALTFFLKFPRCQYIQSESKAVQVRVSQVVQVRLDRYNFFFSKKQKDLYPRPTSILIGGFKCVDIFLRYTMVPIGAVVVIL